jgi:hypothetical protein
MRLGVGGMRWFLYHGGIGGYRDSGAVCSVVQSS